MYLCIYINAYIEWLNFNFIYVNSVNAALCILHCQGHGNSGMSQPSFQNAATVMQPSNIASRFPAVVDPLTQAAVAQVGAVYQAAAAAAYKAVAASGFVPSLSQNVPSLAPQPNQPPAGLARDFNILHHIILCDFHRMM